jgi:hypothetical protein
MSKDLKAFASAILTTLFLAAVVVLAAFYHRPAHSQGKAPVGDMLYAMVTIQQPLAITDDMFDNYRVGGDLYSSNDKCMAAARQAMLVNTTEMSAGTAEYRVFAGCITIPAPGKSPFMPPAPKPASNIRNPI